MAKRLYDDPNDELYDPATAAPPRDSADAVMRDRVRVSTILDSAEGKRNPTLARELALQRGMGADAAVSLLAMVPGNENPLAAAGNPYLQALDKECAIDLGAPVVSALNTREARKAELQKAGRQLSLDRGYSTRGGKA